MRLRALCCAALLGLLVSPGLADIVVTMNPAAQTVDISAGTASVELWADIPEEDAIVGFAFDVDVAGSSIAFDSFAYNAALFDEMPDGDGDGIQGLVPLLDPPVFGNVLLGEMTFSLVGYGTSFIDFSDDGPPLEGFAKVTPGEFAVVDYVGGHITVVPEPSALALLALGGLALLRRR